MRCRPVVCTWIPLLLLGCALSSCSRQAGPPPAPPAPKVSVAQPIGRTVVDFDEFNGRVDAVETVQLRARVSGYLQKVNFHEGEIVKQGDVLVTLDREPFGVEMERLAAEVRRATSALALARNNQERGERLVATNAISQEEFDTISKQRDQSEANLAAARASLRSAQLNYEYTQVRAPITGRVGRALVTQGNLITGGLANGTLLTTIVSQDPIYVLFDADENAFLRYEKLAVAGTRTSGREDKKKVLLALGDETEFTREGVMDFVDNRIDPGTGTIKARGVFENKAGRILTPGMFARIRLPGSGEYAALLIEDRAVMTDLGRRIVFTVDASNTVVVKPVEIGPMNQGLRIVRSGLGKDDLVIVDGLQRARPGVKVTPTKGAMQPLKLVVAQPGPGDQAK
ncbi:efflux RND transporter periplasmic adaptor subunit [Cupriavidus sp. 8B]